VKAVLALEAVRRKREDRYARVMRPLDRRRDALAAEVATRRRALSSGQLAAAQRLLAMIAQAAVSDGTANRVGRYPARMPCEFLAVRTCRPFPLMS